MPEATPLIPAAFVDRPNRFVVRARIDDENVVEAHLADPGRLVELLLPGVELRLRPAPEGAQRKTAYSVTLVRSPGDSPVWVSLEASRANALVESLWSEGMLPQFDRDWTPRREVSHGDSRFDFCFETGERRSWLEVKSVTLVEDGVGLFPDAPTVRGRRHVTELMERVEAGDGAGVLFVVQRSDAASVRAHDGIDPEFASALSAARERGVSVDAIRFALSPDGGADYRGSIPVIFDSES